MIQALLELGCTMPRSKVVTFMKTRKIHTPRRKIDFFEFLNGIAHCCFEYPATLPEQMPRATYRDKYREDLDEGRYGRRGSGGYRRYSDDEYGDMGIRNGRCSPGRANSPRGGGFRPADHKFRPPGGGGGRRRELRRGPKRRGRVR